MAEFRKGQIVEYTGEARIINDRMFTPSMMGATGIVKGMNVSGSVEVAWILPLDVKKKTTGLRWWCPENLRVIGEVNDGEI
jgi:hypothetical protein